MHGIGKCHHPDIYHHVKTADIKDISSRVKLMKENCNKFHSPGGGLPWNRLDIKDISTLKEKLTSLITFVKEDRKGHNPRKELQLDTIKKTLCKIESKTRDYDRKVEAADKHRAYVNSPAYDIDRQRENQARKEKYS